MISFRQIRRPLRNGETVPQIPSLYEQTAGINGGIAHVIPEPPDSTP